MQRLIDTIFLVVLGTCGIALTWLNWDSGAAKTQARGWFIPDRPTRAATQPTGYVYVAPAVYTLEAGAPLPHPTVDTQGRLEPTAATRTYLETQAKAAPNEPDQQMRDRLTEVLLHESPASPRTDATAVVERYVQYRHESRALITQYVAGKASGRFADALDRLRARIFGDSAAKWFTDATSDVILDDHTLPLKVREARILAVMGSAILSLQEARKLEIEVAAVNHEEARMRASGAASSEIMRLRLRFLGAEAAQRLARLDGSN